MKDWYLIGNNTKPNMIGGFENQGFLNCKNDAFLETLETDIATTVLLCNHDLSESKEIRAIIQGNTASTYLTSMERSILVPINTLHSGDYIYFENEYWIVDGRPGNNKVYEKATIKECQYKLKWQKSDGTIIERWANLTSASKYDVGENGNNTIILSSNNYTVVIPYDDDGMTLYGQRVFIDASSIPEKVFKITRNDDVLFLHGDHGGTLSLIADKTELNLKTDNQKLRLCNYVQPHTLLPPLNETNKTNSTISGIKHLKTGFQRTYTAMLYDSDGNAINWDESVYSWNIESSFDVPFTVADNTITLLIQDESLIGLSFILSVLQDSTVIAQEIIDIVEGF